MELLKWIFSVIASIVIVCLGFAAGAVLTVIGGIASVIGMGALVVGVIAVSIKAWFTRE